MAPGDEVSIEADITTRLGEQKGSNAGLYHNYLGSLGGGGGGGGRCSFSAFGNVENKEI